MAQAVTHFLFAAILVALFRDKYLKYRDRRHFPVHYLFVAGLGGVLPDLDFFALMILQFFGFTYEQVHRTFSHTLLFALILLVIGLVLHLCDNPQFGKRHKMKWSCVFYILSFGSVVHIILDMIYGGGMLMLWPLSDWTINISLLNYIPQQIAGVFPALVDGILLVVWIFYLEMKHKISDYI